MAGLFASPSHRRQNHCLRLSPLPLCANFGNEFDVPVFLRVLYPGSPVALTAPKMTPTMRGEGGATRTCPPFTSLTTRGYTDQEMLDAVCLVNLNGRIYDPTIGRILSADRTVQDASDGQSYNRYSYVRNGPTFRTDPTGYDDAGGSAGDSCQAENSNCDPEAGQGNGSSGNPEQVAAVGITTFCTPIFVFLSKLLRH